MARGSKESYSNKQKRQAEHIEDSYKKRGVSDKTAEARAWATVNKTTGGGKKSGSGRGAAKKSTSRSRKSTAKKSSPSRKRKTGARKTSGRKTSARKTARKTATRARKRSA